MWGGFSWSWRFGVIASIGFGEFLVFFGIGVSKFYVMVINEFRKDSFKGRRLFLGFRIRKIFSILIYIFRKWF